MNTVDIKRISFMHFPNDYVSSVNAHVQSPSSKKGASDILGPALSTGYLGQQAVFTARSK
jgi:hypothetical protein